MDETKAGIPVSLSTPAEIAATQVTVHGIVQGVGFRPFVFNLASELRLRGSVRNAGGVVEIALVGADETIQQFVARLRGECPPLAVIEMIETRAIDIIHDQPEGFVIEESTEGTPLSSRVPADAATCADCLKEVFDQTNRRYQYPFTNCTNCGPRFTVISGLPYDRDATTMACFPMCVECESEYRDPFDRRFHAQPNACWVCGPQLWFFESDCITPESLDNTAQRSSADGARAEGMHALARTVDALKNGEIVAVKGLGGFHLACNATNEETVAKLRNRKRRNGKPFAVMFESIEQIAQYCAISDDERRLLSSRQRPIVLLDTVRDQPLSASITNGLGWLGTLLPYTPLQVLLMQKFGAPLVMTSANLHEEPIVTGNREALQRLHGVADAFLLNDRDIHCRFDDSVSRIVAGAPMMIRRARSYAPEAIAVPIRSPATVLALGGHLKNTFTLLHDGQAYVSQHIGDTNSLETVQFLQDTIAHFEKLFSLRPDTLACDLHPDYETTRLAQELCFVGENCSGDAVRGSLKLVQVQHHHAHIAACMAEHGVTSPVIGISFDGVGYGDDGTAWGGEFLLCEYKLYKRLARFLPVPMPGGEAAVRNPWRMAVAYLDGLAKGGNARAYQALEQISGRVGVPAVSAVRQQLERRLNSPETSSCGRLFDAVSCLLGLCDSAEFEGQAAMLLETVASPASKDDSNDNGFDLGMARPRTARSVRDIDTSAIIANILESSDNIANTAYKFHVTIAELIVGLGSQLCVEHGVDTVCLSGGVFQNKLLCELILQRATDKIRWLLPRKLPPNDGGLSLGQAVIAAAQLEN